MLLGVPESLLEEKGSVSKDCTEALATLAGETLKASYAIGITGFASPCASDVDGVGTCWISIYALGHLRTQHFRIKASRRGFQIRATEIALTLLIETVS